MVAACGAWCAPRSCAGCACSTGKRDSPTPRSGERWSAARWTGPAGAGRLPAHAAHMTLDELNALPEAEAHEAFARCCGASRWVGQMVARRPFVGVQSVLGIAFGFWMGLGPEDWREAFTHHPRIGDLESLKRRFASTADLASREQSAVAAASRVVLEALAEGNRAYEERFGYIFIVFA